MTTRPISLGETDGTWVQITEGLEVGDTVLYLPSALSYADLMMPME